PTLQFASTHPPPMPIHADEYSSWPLVCCVAVGTVQSPVMLLNRWPFSRAPWLYPDQLFDWFAFTATIVPCTTGTAVAAGAAANIRATIGPRIRVGRFTSRVSFARA